MVVGRTYRVGRERRTVCAVCQLHGRLREVSETSDRKVLLVGVRGGDDVLRLLHAVEYIRFAVLVAVSTNTQVYLAGVLVGLECLRDT